VWSCAYTVLTPLPPSSLQIYIAGLAMVRDISLHEEYVQLGDNASAEDELDVRTNIPSPSAT